VAAGKLPAITKLEAARRQIDFAIAQHFSEGDPFAIHTVIAAAFGILRALAKRKGNLRIEQAFTDRIRPGMENQFWNFLNRVSNFLKHADRDPDATLDDVNEGTNEATLFVVSIYYTELVGAPSDAMRIYQAWYGLLHPKVLTDDYRRAILEKVPQMAESFSELPRKLQLKGGLMALARTLPSPPGTIRLPGWE
jgi:hypothetical protein